MSRALWLAGGALVIGLGLLLVSAPWSNDPPEHHAAAAPPDAGASAAPAEHPLEHPVGPPGKAPVPKAATSTRAPRFVEPPPPPDGNPALQGLQLETADSSALSRAGVPAGTNGLLVRSVDPASSAAEASLEPGDVITKAQRDKLDTMDALVAAVGDRGFTVLTVYRKGSPFQTVLNKPFDGGVK